jgi:hypothetical protein
MPVAAPIALAGATIGSALIGSSAARRGARAEEALGREGLALQERMFNQQRADTEPWRRIGGQSLGDAYAMTQPGYDHTTSPGYQFRLGEGLRAVQNSAAARGLLQSGGTLKGIDRYAEGLAADDYDRQFNRHSTLAGFGSTANGQMGAASQNYANAGSNILGNIGQARASGYAGQAAAYQQGLGSLASLFGQFGGFGK